MVGRIKYIIPIFTLLFCAIHCKKFEDEHKTTCFPPYIDFKVKVDSASQIVTIDSIVKLNGPFNKFNWDFGDGKQLNNIERPSPHSYPNKTVDTTYNIKLTVSNNCQEISTWYKPVLINGCLVVGSFDTIINNYNVTFINTTKPGAIKVISYLWNFGDGTTDNSQNPPVHTYSSYGVKNVILSVTTSCGTTKVNKSISITCSKEVACNDCIKVIHNSWSYKTFFIQNTTGIIKVEWDFGDNSGIETGFTNMHNYKSSGTFTVTATIFNECKSKSYPYYPIIIIQPEEDIFDLPQTGNYKRIVYFKDKVYVLDFESHFYSYDPLSNHTTTLANSQIQIDDNLRLKKDAFGNTLWNFGTNGLRKFNNGQWDSKGKTIHFNDVDCDKDMNFIPAVDVESSIVYNTFKNLFYTIDNSYNSIKSRIYGSGYNMGQPISEIDNSSYGLIHNPNNGDMFFINSNGIVQIDYNRLIKKRFYINNFIPNLNALPIKIELADDSNIIALLNNGSLIKFNIETYASSIVWQSGLSDFDILTNSKGETEIFICGNRILKRIVL